MPRPYQIIPKNSFPTEETYVNDNTVVTPSAAEPVSNNTSFLYVVSSPKGKDGVMQTFNSQQDFLDKIGLGPFSLYGQPLLSAYAVLGTGRASVHLLRVAADDARYSNIHVCAAYRTDDQGKMHVKFYAKPSTGALASLDGLADAYVPNEEPDSEGYTEVKLFSVAALGRGKYGNNFQIRLSSLKTADRENDFKNYTFEVYESETNVTLKESFHVCFSENAVIGITSYFADSVVNDPNNGSDYVRLISYPEGFAQITAAYKAVIEAYNAKEDTSEPYNVFTVDDIDIFGGENKYTKKALPLYEIETAAEGTINPYGVDGYPDIACTGGTDGALDASIAPATRENTLNALYLKGYSGQIDPMIKSKNKFPTTFILDCNFNAEIKAAIAGLNAARTDSVAIYDSGTSISTVQSVIPTVKELCGNMVDTYEAVDAYCGKIRDPYNQKVITVTSTYALGILYARQFHTVDGKGVPLADNEYGNLNDIFIEGTIYPVFDEDIHADLMNDLIDEKINFARNNALGQINRATQTTRQNKLSVLSELNNVLLLKDVKRAMEKMTAKKRYNFAEADDIKRFNVDARWVASTFNGKVASIEAAYGQSDYEADYSIVHLYVTLVCKKITKTTIIEIDVNRA